MAVAVGQVIAAEFQSALPRGERLINFGSSRVMNVFQSALPRGERPSISPASSFGIAFQSALPRGERPKEASLPAT